MKQWVDENKPKVLKLPAAGGRDADGVRYMPRNQSPYPFWQVL
jgi:hypothetical protein